MRFGILGGIGPDSSSYVYAEIIKRLKQRGAIRRNTDYPQIIINSINAPELVTTEVSDEMLEPFVQGIRELASVDPAFIIMACNTIHVFRDHLVKQSQYDQISDMTAIVTKHLAEIKGTLAVIGTHATVTTGLYHIDGRDYINPTNEQLQTIADVIIDYNATGEVADNRARLLDIIADRRKAGAEIFIAGCTEISELLHGVEGIKLVDTLELLIEDTLARITAPAIDIQKIMPQREVAA